MTASRNTILALGLMLLALAAGNAALAASAPGCDCSSGEKGSGTCGQTTSDAGCNSNGTCDCNAGCNSGCEGTDRAGCGIGCKSGRLSHDPDCRYSTERTGRGGTDSGLVEEDPVLGDYTSCLDDFRETCAGCCVKAEVSALYMRRSSPGTRTVLFDPATRADLYDAADVDFSYELGPRISLTVLDCEGWGVEVNYFGVDGWESTRDLPNSKFPSGTADLVVDKRNQLSLLNAHFDSIARLYSTEVNFRRPLCGSFSGLAGFRWMEITDQYRVDGTSATTGNGIFEKILTHNHMYGFQLGTDGTIAKEADRWRIMGFLKGGIFLNNAEQATALSDPGTLPTNLGYHALNNNNLGAAFFGETGVTGYFQVTKHFSVSGGYQIMFVDGVAQPVNQLAGMNFANNIVNVDASAGLIYHGASAGFELTW